MIPIHESNHCTSAEEMSSYSCFHFFQSAALLLSLNGPDFLVSRMGTMSGVLGRILSLFFLRFMAVSWKLNLAGPGFLFYNALLKEFVNDWSSLQSRPDYPD